jgi:protein-S-isoprenylcysteine O-methyltransferase Ste14
MAAQGRGVRDPADRRRASLTLKELIGSGDKIALVTLPFAVVGVILNVALPSVFEVGGPSDALRMVSLVMLALGVIVWIWSVALVLVKVPRGELITSGPFALVKHPIYSGVSLLVLPWLGFLMNTWLGAFLGIVMYIGTRRYAPQEEAELSETFGPAWDDYRRSVKIPWL